MPEIGLKPFENGIWMKENFPLAGLAGLWNLLEPFR
jgi:hypothetical protein